MTPLRLRDPKLLVLLRQGRPDEKGRPGRTLTQRQAAARVGISHGHYGDIEAGRRRPSPAVGARIAVFYGVTMHALYEGVPAEHGDPGADA